MQTTPDSTELVDTESRIEDLAFLDEAGMDLFLLQGRLLLSDLFIQGLYLTYLRADAAAADPRRHRGVGVCVGSAHVSTRGLQRVR